MFEWMNKATSSYKKVSLFQNKKRKLMKTHLKQVQHFSGEENSKFKQNPYTVYIPKGKNITEESTGVFAVPSVCCHSKHHHHSHHHTVHGTSVFLELQLGIEACGKVEQKVNTETLNQRFKERKTQTLEPLCKQSTLTRDKSTHYIHNWQLVWWESITSSHGPWQSICVVHKSKFSQWSHLLCTLSHNRKFYYNQSLFFIIRFDSNLPLFSQGKLPMKKCHILFNWNYLTRHKRAAVIQLIASKIWTKPVIVNWWSLDTHFFLLMKSQPKFIPQNSICLHKNKNVNPLSIMSSK